MASDLINLLRSQQAGGGQTGFAGATGFGMPQMQPGMGNPFQFLPQGVGSPAQPSGAWGPLMGGMIQSLPFAFQRMFPWLSPQTMQAMLGGTWNSMQGLPKNTGSMDGKPSGMAPTAPQPANQTQMGPLGLLSNPLLYGAQGGLGRSL